MVLPLNTPKVSVCVITYNQEKFIGQCLQSIVDQKTDFEFEVIVGDDCSTDSTPKIVKEFAAKYPEVVKPIYQDKNIGGGTHNFLTVHNAAKGKYIAHVDGDDYCLPNKLQRQANLLDSDQDCNIVFHRMFLEKKTGEIIEGPLSDFENIIEMRFDRGELIKYIVIGFHSSKMYRKEFRDYVLPNFDITDYFANVEHIGKGYARFVGRESYGVYRVGQGIASVGVRSRKALASSFVYFSKKYPEHRLQANTAALTYFIADLKNWRKTWPMFGMVWMKTFHVASICCLLDGLKLMKKLRLNS